MWNLYTKIYCYNPFYKSTHFQFYWSCLLQNDWLLHQCWQLWKKKSRIDVFETRINKHCFLILSKFCFSNVKATTKENKCCAIFFFAKLEELYWKPISCCQVLMMQFDEKALSTWVFSRHATLLYSVELV